jgi:hypothetical protein
MKKSSQLESSLDDCIAEKTAGLEQKATKNGIAPLRCLCLLLFNFNPVFISCIRVFRGLRSVSVHSCHYHCLSLGRQLEFTMVKNNCRCQTCPRYASTGLVHDLRFTSCTRTVKASSRRFPPQSRLSPMTMPVCSPVCA